MSTRTVSYPAIPEDVIIDIQISGLFYRQLVNNLLAVGDTLPPEEFKTIMDTLSQDTFSAPKDANELTIRSLTSLIFELESKAHEQKKTKVANMNINDDTGEVTPVTES
jgi:hypothetical protein